MESENELKARTEAAYREVNEVIARAAAQFEAEEADFVCECGDPHCAHRVTAQLDEYERVRADSTQFLLAVGHDDPEVERVVARGSGYRIVEKLGASVQRIVRGLDPRAAES
jgi:hypothetical protein